SARADSARADSARADSARAAQRVAPVVVTVLRTPMDAGRAPFAVSANGPDDVRRARPGPALDEALRNIPGVQVDNRYNAAAGGPRSAPVSAGGRAAAGSSGPARWQAGLGGRTGSADWSLRGARLQYDGFRQFSSQTSTRVTGTGGAGVADRGLGALRASLE